MKSNLEKILILILAAILSSNTIAQDISKSGTSAAHFLEIGVGATAIGMGGAFVSIANDASALYWNAGGIANIPGYEFIAVHTNWIADTKFDFAGLVIPMGNFGTLGFSFTSLSMNDMKVTTVEMPDGTGEFFSAGDKAFGLTYAKQLTDRFSIGFTAKYIQQSIWHMNASAFALDIGSVFKTDLLGGITIGASINNFGTPMKMEGRDSRYFIRIDETKQGSSERIPTNIEMDEWELPLIFQIGISTDPVKTENYRLTVAIDAIHPSNNYQSVNLGGELVFMEFLFFRGGFQSLFLQDSEGGLVVGLGVNSKMLFSETLVKFDYAYRDFGRLQNVHTFSLNVRF
ncbi:PorV/PorQ family protein [Bacteroidota bacterium]